MRHAAQELSESRAKESEAQNALTEARETATRLGRDLRLRDKRVADLERDVSGLAASVEEHRVRAERLRQDLQAAEGEARRLADALAECTTKREEAEAAARKASQELGAAKHRRGAERDAATQPCVFLYLVT